MSICKPQRGDRVYPDSFFVSHGNTESRRSGFGRPTDRPSDALFVSTVPKLHKHRLRSHHSVPLRLCEKPLLWENMITISLPSLSPEGGTDISPGQARPRAPPWVTIKKTDLPCKGNGTSDTPFPALIV